MWRRPMVQDGVLAALLAVAAVVSVAAEGWACACPGTPAVGYAVLVATHVPLVVRRRRPLAAWALVGAGTVVYGMADWVDPVVMAPVLVAIYTVAAHLDGRRATAVGGASVAVILGSWLADPAPNDVNDLLSPALGFSTAWLAGRAQAAHRTSIRLLRERAERLERERDAVAHQVMTEERLRIARELHDVTAHHVSVVAVQAEAGRAVLATRPDEAGRRFEAIAASARAALADLRRVLGVLRSDEAPALAPQPGLDDLEALAEQVRGAGVDVALSLDPSPEPVPEAVGVSAYRIVQEALTNVLKHAGASRVDVHVRRSGRGIEIEVVDDGRLASGGDGPGHGLAGMRERVELYGGRLEAGPVAGGGFRVLAALPA